MAKDVGGWKMIVLVVIIVACAVAAHWGARKFELFTNDDVKNKLETVTGMIVFTLDGCGHCDKFKSEVLSNLESDNFLEIKQGSPDANAIIEKWNVQGFPTIYFLKKGQKMKPPGSGSNGEYEGSRDLTTIKEHLKVVMNA